MKKFLKIKPVRIVNTEIKATGLLKAEKLELMVGCVLIAVTIPEIDKKENMASGSFSNNSLFKNNGKKDDKRFKELSRKIGKVKDIKLSDIKNFFSTNKPSDKKTKTFRALNIDNITVLIDLIRFDSINRLD